MPPPPRPALVEPPAHQLGKPGGEIELRLRPRVLPLAVLLVAPIALLVFLTGLAYRTGDFDPRVVPLAAMWLFTSATAATAKLSVSGGAVWRRMLVVTRAVSLDALASVQVRRAKYFKQEGLPTRIVEVRDRYGRVMTWKPALWANRRALEGLLGSYVTAQRLSVDDATRTYLAEASTFGAPAVVVASPGPFAQLPPPPGFAAAPPPTKVSAKQAVVLGTLFVAMAALTIGSVLAGPRVLGSIRCANERDRWTTHADVGGASLDPISSTEAIADPLAPQLGEPQLTVGAAFVPPGAPTSFHQVAQAHVHGQGVTWGGRGLDLNAFVEVDRYSSHEAALAYVREWGEWSCAHHEFFEVPDVPGAVGFRIADRSIARDHVVFVRGDTVVHAMTVVEESANQQAAGDLAVYASGR